MMSSSSTTTALNADKAPKRSMRQQWRDLRSRFDALSWIGKTLVIALLVLLGYLIVDQYSWGLARAWAARSEKIEAALQRNAARGDLVTQDLRKQVAVYGPVVPPKSNDEGGETLSRSIESILAKHKVTGVSFDRRAGQRMRDPESSAFGGAGLERLQADVKFETDGAQLPAILADLEGNENITAISSLRIQGPGQPGSQRVTVQATIESWVQAARSRRGQ
jgi:hypothetical protein